MARLKLLDVVNIRRKGIGGKCWDFSALKFSSFSTIWFFTFPQYLLRLTPDSSGANTEF